jgi:hypothetical protein
VPGISNSSRGMAMRQKEQTLPQKTYVTIIWHVAYASNRNFSDTTLVALIKCQKHVFWHLLIIYTITPIKINKLYHF